MIDKDAISIKIFLKEGGAWAVIQNFLGFYFDGNQGEHTIWLTDDLFTDIVDKLKKFINEGENRKRASLLRSFERVFQTENAFISIPVGKGLLSLCNQMLGNEPPNIFLHQNKSLLLNFCD